MHPDDSEIRRTVLALSVSKIDCLAVLKGKGQAKVNLFKHFAPVTVSAITRELPIIGRVSIYPGAMLCIMTSLRLGVEKQKLEFSRGDLAFVPATGSVCFFFSNVKSERPLNPIGKVEEGLDLLGAASIGDVIELKAARE